MGININLLFIMLFLLAHLFGDFVLQTNKIAHMKSTSVRGVWNHIIIIFVMQVLFLGYFGISGLIAAIIGAAMHFGIDLLKLATNKIFNKIQLVYFIFDQLLHLSVIYILTIILKPEMQISVRALSENQIQNLAQYLIYIIIYTYVITVMGKILLRDIFEDIRRKRFFFKYERVIDSIICVLLFFAFIRFSVYAFIAASIIGGIAYYIIHVKKYSYNAKEILIKYGFYLSLIILGGISFSYIMPV